MAITGTGKFIGYTLGGIKPTLYFEVGRYTQVHNDPLNIGWHPIEEGGKVYGNNVTATEVTAFNQAGAKKDGSVNKLPFIQKMIGGSYAEQPNAVKAFEVTVNGNGEISKYHMSRSKMIRPGDKNYNTKYGSVYVENVLKNGDFARNTGMHDEGQ